jgi:anti-sigma factor RsiW
MRQVRDEELSALLDGELDPRRAEEVRALIQADPALRAEFDALAQLDSRLSAAAAETAFTPEVSFPESETSGSPAWQWGAGLAVVVALIIIRLLPKVVELPLFGIGLQLAACAAIAIVVLAMARESEPLASPGVTKGIGS